MASNESELDSKVEQALKSICLVESRVAAVVDEFSVFTKSYRLGFVVKDKILTATQGHFLETELTNKPFKNKKPDTELVPFLKAVRLEYDGEESKKPNEIFDEDGLLIMHKAYFNNKFLEPIARDTNIGYAVYPLPEIAQDAKQKPSPYEFGVGSNEMVQVGRMVLVLGSVLHEKPKAYPAMIRAVSAQAFSIITEDPIQPADGGAAIIDSETLNLLGILKGTLLPGSKAIMSLATSIDVYKPYL
jgi:hypothetical protein